MEGFLTDKLNNSWAPKFECLVMLTMAMLDSLDKTAHFKRGKKGGIISY